MDDSIYETIQKKLSEIEAKENVRILHCVESGSRAWGFASPDSDYDVRFIYARPKDYYLRLEKTRDVIEWQLDDTLDINGWDIQKALRLLHNSNPTLFEWNSSPIVYKTIEDWTRVSAVIDDFFLKKSGLYHYLNTAKSNYREYLHGDVVKTKKYFYVLRPVLACRWILKFGSPPPMLFEELVNNCLDPTLKPAVDNLLKQKRNTSEIGYGNRIDILNEYLDKSIEELSTIVNEMPSEGKRSWETLNELFISLL